MFTRLRFFTKAKIFCALVILTINASSQSFDAKPFAFSDTTFKKGQFLPLWDIYFELGRPELKTTLQLQLDSLVDFLKNNKNLNVEIGVHTDFRGDDKLNLALSQKRAITLTDYLISKGILRSRLIAIGFGETKTVISYENWQKISDTHRCGYYGRTNRRITVVIL